MSDTHKLQNSIEILQEYTTKACKSSCVQADLLNTLTNVTETLVATRDKTATELASISQRMATIEANMLNMQKDVATLCKLVRDGNGQPSLLQRLNTVEIYTAANKAELEELSENANSIIASRSLTKSHIVSGIIAMAITAIMSGLALAVTLIKG